MSQVRIFGIVLLVVGAVVLAVGMNASHSVADQVSDTFTGRFTSTTAWYLIGSPRGRSPEMNMSRQIDIRRCLRGSMPELEQLFRGGSL
jgi:hypothetical protein